MEALINSRIVPLQVPCRKLELSRYPSRGRVSIINHPKFLRPVTASVLPQEDLSAYVVPCKEILHLWRNAEVVCLDVDSTVCVDEGIDELAEFCGAGKAVAEWTAWFVSNGWICSL